MGKKEEEEKVERKIKEGKGRVSRWREGRGEIE